MEIWQSDKNPFWSEVQVLQEAKFRSVFENTSRVAVYLSEAWGLIRSKVSYLLSKTEKVSQKKYRVVIADGGVVNSSNIIHRLEDALSLFRDTLVRQCEEGCL